MAYIPLSAAAATALLLGGCGVVGGGSVSGGGVGVGGGGVGGGGKGRKRSL